MRPGPRIESLLKAGSGRMAAAERRLRQIFTLFDHGNPKKALQAIEKLLQKLPSPEPCFLLALKCLASFRAGRRADAHKLSTQLFQHPDLLGEPNAVAVFAQYLRESDQLVQLEKLYQSAVDRDQTEENLNSLFYAQLMTGSCERQRHTATKLHKLTGKALYNMWSICCMLRQARSLPEGDHQRDVLLRLCARIADALDNLFFRVAVAEVAKDYGKIQQLLDRDTIELPQWRKREQEYLQQVCMCTIIETCHDESRLLLLLRNRFPWFTVNWNCLTRMADKLVGLLKSKETLRDYVDWLEPLRVPPTLAGHDPCEDIVTALVDKCCLEGNSPVMAQTPLATIKIEMDRARAVPAMANDVYQVDPASLLIIYFSSRLDARLLFTEVKRYLRHYGMHRPCRFDLCGMMDHIRPVRCRQLLAIYLYEDFVKNWSTTETTTMLVNVLSVVNRLSSNVLIGQWRLSADEQEYLRTMDFRGAVQFADEDDQPSLTYVYLEDVLGPALEGADALLNGELSDSLDELKPPTYRSIQQDNLAFLRFASALAAHWKQESAGDLSPSDSLQIMCVGAVHDYDCFFECVCMLEDQLARRPVHLYATLLLIRLYSMCGAYDCIEEHFRAMNVKNIQSYSLAHLIVNDTMRLGCWSQALNTLDMLGRAMSANREETAASLVELLQSDQMINVEHATIYELSELVRNFPRQVELVSCRINLVCAWLLVKDDLLDCDLPQVDHDLCDTRDFRPLYAFCSADHDLERQREQSLRESQAMASLRRSVLRRLAGQPVEETRSVEMDHIRFCIHGPSPTGWHTLQSLELASLVEQHEQLTPTSVEACVTSVSKLHGRLKGLVSLLNFAHPGHVGLLIETLALTVEFGSYSLLFLRKAGPVNHTLRQQWQRLLDYVRKLCFEEANRSKRYHVPSDGRFYRFQRPAADVTIKRIADAQCSCFAALRSIVELRIATLERL